MTLAAAPLAGPLHHGGRLRQAAEHYGIPLAAWLDLSTGINPNGWPVPAVPAAAWSRLPEDEDGLEQEARAYYGAEHLLPVAGSQAAIQTLPWLRPPCRVGVLSPGYAEHAAAWRRAGHEVRAVSAEEMARSLSWSYREHHVNSHEAASRTLDHERLSRDFHTKSGARAGSGPDQPVAEEILESSDVLVLIHPNNPTGARFPQDKLLDWHARLAARGGWLVVDEAFMDVTPEASLCPLTSRPNLIVLRSLGKFFGLAGARLGFVCAQPPLLAALHHRLGPWTVNAPARWVATLALADGDWHAQARPRLAAAGERLRALLARQGLAPAGGCALFQWSVTPQAPQLHQALARQGILTRLFQEPASLRLGLPGSEADWARLERALAGLIRPQAEIRA